MPGDSVLADRRFECSDALGLKRATQLNTFIHEGS